MKRWFLDTSAALKLVVDEPESVALVHALDSFDGEVVGSWLLETEMRRAAHRIDALEQAIVTQVLSKVSMYELQASVFREAGLLPGGNLRSLDAIHIAVAVRLGVDAVVTYDQRMAEACELVGLPVQAPGRFNNFEA